MSRTTSASRPVGGQRALITVGFLIFVELTSGFIQGYYMPLFGALTARFGISDAQITWFMAVWTLASAVAIPVMAKLGDMFGHRRVLRIAVLFVLLGVCFVAFSQNYALVLVGRALTGPLSVWLPLEIALIHDKISGDGAHRSVGLLITSLTIGSFLGMLAAGAASRLDLSFTVVLLIPAAATLLCALVVFFLVPESTTRAPGKLDTLGFIGLAVFMVLLLLGLSGIQEGGFGSAQVLVPLVISAVVLFCWIFWELRLAAPAIDLRFVASRTMSPAYLSSFVLGAVILGTQTLLPTFLASNPDRAGFGYGFEPGVISMFVAGAVVMSCAGAVSFAYIARVIGLRGVLILGSCMGMAGNLILILFPQVFAMVIVSQVVLGFGMGTVVAALPSLLAEVSPPDQTGIATGIYNSLKTLGGAVGGAVFGVVMSATVVPGIGATLGAYRTVWGVAVAGLVVCAVSFAIMRTGRPSPDEFDGEREDSPQPGRQGALRP